MKVRSIIAIAMAVVLGVSMLTIWFYPSIQDYMMANPFWNGLRDFSDDMDVHQADSLTQSCANPTDTVLMEIPYAPYEESALVQIESFVKEGGTLLLADDYGYGNTVLERLGLAVRFSGQPLLDPLLCHKNQWLPRIIDFSDDLDETGIEAVVLNHGTALLDSDEESCIAWSSESSFLDLDGNGESGSDDRKGPLPVAAGYSIGKGRVLALSDPSVLINSMVNRDDNRAFIDQILKTYGEGKKVTMDMSRLPKAPLDESKQAMTKSRERISHPYSVIAMLGIVVFAAFKPWKRKEAD